ncbi:helix-turn-helix domain-containing protein [Micromonospora sp. MS34]|uniref:helix-turn-helix domain-containing protein n=1 Tax=Micromonospora sp. MS34 TaxID=3385971 RepID=UPI0039A27883
MAPSGEAGSPCGARRGDSRRHLGVPVGTLYQWRHRRTGPRASRVGRHLRYDPAAVRAWVTEREG